MQRSAVIAVLLAALALAGCGPFGGKSDEDQVRDTVDQLVTARNQSHFADVCSLFASAQLAQFKKANTTCEKFLQQHAAPDTTTTIRVEQVRVEGDRATVDATVSHNAGAGNAESILLVKENGDWKVTQVGF
jgi:PBP1b-binding outer membrane lipoprotein LpoB